MIYLSNILLEIENDPQADKAADELGHNIEDLIQGELEKTNEGVLTIAAITLALPGIIDGMAKIGKSLGAKYHKGFKVSKENPNAWYNVLEKFVEKIDNYIGKPFDLLLKPVIKDENKRKKAVNVLKAIAITTLAVIGTVDISKTTTVLAYFKSVAGSFYQELIQLASQKSIPNIITFAKKAIPSLLR